MAKVKSIEELAAMRERLRAGMAVRENGNHPEELPQVRVGMGECGVAAGAKDTMREFFAKLAERGVAGVVTQTGCMGHCDAEPTVEVEMPGCEPVLYGNVTPDVVDEIIDSHICHGEPVRRLVLTEGVVGRNIKS